MPPTASTLRVGRYFLSLLLILVVLYGLVFLPGRSRTPKLGIDLVGGAQITFTAKTPAGKTPSASSMRVAREILDQRVNGSGVSAAQVYQQGSDQIVIAVPGASAEAKAKLASIGRAAQLNLRPLVMAAVTPPTPTTPTTGATTSGAATTGGATSSGSASASTTAKATTSGSGTAKSTTSAAKTTAAATSAQGLTGPLGFAPTTGATTTGATTSAAATSSAAATTSASPSATSSASAGLPAADLISTKALGFAVPTTETAYDALTTAQQSTLQTKVAQFDCSTNASDDPAQVLLSCDSSGYRYLLGPVVVKGTQITNAAAVAPNLSGTGGSAQWTVSIDMSGSGQTAWANWTSKHNTADLDSTVTASASAAACSAATVPCADFVAFTLDQTAISVPATNSTINGSTSVSGSFTESTAKELADQLRFGALPLSFDPSEAQDISATLGTSQLRAGLLAGGIGLILVVIYSLLYYRGLGLVTVASLIVSGGLTYASLVILGHEMGFTLTLSGIAGFIVAIGITADSFVVFFERLKDEVHEGRSIRVAVPRAWTRSRRTILSADTVSFLAAAVLYYFSASDVRGFAFTLGLSTILDLVVVFLFTHPLISLLSRSRTFGSPRFTGLNAVRRGSTPLIADDDGGARRPSPPRSRPTRAPSRSGVALLEPDVDTSLDTDSDRDDDGEVGGIEAFDSADASVAQTGFDEEMVDDTELADAQYDASRAAQEDSAPAEAAPAARPTRGRRSRVVAREAPTEIGLSAAERAAARRGRTARPRAVEPELVDEDELEIAENEFAEDQLDENEAENEVEAGFDDDTSVEDELVEAETEAVDEVVENEADDEAVDDAAVADVVEVEVVEEVVDAAPAPGETPARSETPAAAPEPVDDTPKSAAAARAAARRARIRAQSSDDGGES